MDFDLSPEQVALADAARAALAQRWSAGAARAALDQPPVAVPDDFWNEMAAMGWVGIAAPEEVGGSGGDVLTACVLAIEAGRALLPSSLASVIVASIALDRSNDALRLSLLPAVFNGDERVACAIEEPGGTWGPDAVTLAAVESGDDWILDGVKILVPDTEGAGLLLVAARTPLGLGFVAVPARAPGVSIAPMRRLDAQSIAEVRLDEVRVPVGSLLGGPTAGESVLRDTYDIWTVLGAADLLGVSEAALSMATTYASERVQFGRPIGSFQAVAHRLADVFVDTEIARSLLYAACLAVDEGRSNSGMLVSAAKAWASDAAVAATEAALKLHGGLGFAWEVDVHLYLRRARAGAMTLGDADYHRDRIAAHLAESATAGDAT